MPVQYQLSIEKRHEQYLQIEITFSCSEDSTEVKLPTWRPGRYELGMFAKNVRLFQATDENGKSLEWSKTSHSVWQVDTKGITSFKVRYQYFAAELNGGSTFLDDQQLYVNPVNCFMYTESTKIDTCTVQLNVPEAYEIACSLDQSEKVLTAPDFDTLVDAPFIASDSMEHQTFEEGGVLFHLWFQGMKHIPWEKLIEDFRAFTKVQLAKFGEFPVKEYHYLIEIVPYQGYHGVEHHASTVLYLGPTYDVFNKLYKELLGVASHELYHTWNVKALRSSDMYPYDFDKENYSRMGYLCEGVTTYMGDLFLFKGGVFNFDQYAFEFNAQLQKHFDNHGRFNYSVGESSFDTWLDGYQVGAPGRKVSIYTEGCLIAFMTDIRLRQATKDKYGLDELMRRLYFAFAVEKKGVTEADYLAELKNISGEDWTPFFTGYVHGTKGFEGPLTEALEYIGLELVHKPSNSAMESQVGIKASKKGKGVTVQAIYPGSPADMAGIQRLDDIIGINNIQLNNDLNEWLNYFDHESKVLKVVRGGRILDIQLPVLNRTFYNQYSIQKIKNCSPSQEKAFLAWKS